MKRNFSEFINVSYYDDTNSWLKKKEQILEKWIELNDDFELIKNKYASKVEYLTLVKQLIRGKEDIKEIEKDKNLDKEIKDKTIEKKFNTKSTNIVKNISKIKGNLSETRENLKILIEETDLDKTDKCDDEEDEEQSYFTLNQNDSFSIKDQEDQKNWKDEEIEILGRILEGINRKMIKKHLKEDLFEYIYSNLKNELQNKGIPIRFEIQDIINRLKNDVIKLVELHKDRQKKEEDYILSIKYNN